MPRLLLIHEDKRLLLDDSYLQHVSETYGIKIDQISWEDDTPALKELFDSIVTQQPPLLWVLFLSFRVTPFQDFEGPFLEHSGPPFVIPMLLGTNHFEMIFSEKFQNWWRERWEIVLRQNIPAFEGFWRVPGIPVGIISEPFRSERDFDGYLFPWIERWNQELDSASLFGTEHRLLERWARAERKPERKPKRLYVLLGGGAALLAGAVGIVYGQRHGRLLEAIFIVAAIAICIVSYTLISYSFRRSKGYLHLNSKGERRNASAYEHGRLPRILSGFAVLVLLILAGVFLLTSFDRLGTNASVNLTPPPIGVVTQTITPTMTASPDEKVTQEAASGAAIITQEAASGTAIVTPEAVSDGATPTKTSTIQLTHTPTKSPTPSTKSTATRTATATPQSSLTAFAPTNTRTRDLSG